jgi:hypothetical protein
MTDRRTTIKWMLAASASLSIKRFAPAAGSSASGIAARGYGTDPKLVKTYKPGELWPLTFTPAQRKTAAALSDLIIPADSVSPSASAVGVVDFLDEWISAPYKDQQSDRASILKGFAWLDAESVRRHRHIFAELSPEQQTGICDDICIAEKANPEFEQGAKFFALYRDLTAGGFYSTPHGRDDLKYMGNVPLKSFDGPPREVLEKVGLI